MLQWRGSCRLSSKQPNGLSRRRLHRHQCPGLSGTNFRRPIDTLAHGRCSLLLHRCGLIRWRGSCHLNSKQQKLLNGPRLPRHEWQSLSGSNLQCQWRHIHRLELGRFQCLLHHSDVLRWRPPCRLRSEQCQSLSRLEPPRRQCQSLTGST